MNKVSEYIINNFDKVKINSHDIIAGDIFVCLKGSKKHGNIFISKIINKGVKYIITDKHSDINDPKEKIIFVDDIFSYLLKIAIKKRGLYKGKIIGITGSVGKTTVKENLKFFLSYYCKVSASIKSYNNYLGVLISLLNLNLESDFAIFEIGTNNFLEIKKLTSIIMPSQVIITNIYPTHLEKLYSTRNIAIEKSDIFNKKINPNINLVILPNSNNDEKFIVEKAKKEKIENILTFGDNIDSDLYIIKLNKLSANHFKILLSYQNSTFDLTLNQNYYYRINNVLICLLIFLYNNIKLELFFSLSKDMPLIEGRGLQSVIIFDSKKINFIDESYNASPMTMKLSIDYFSDLVCNKNQKKILILGEMKELGENKINFHIELLDYLMKKNLDNVIICGELFKLALKKTINNKIKYMVNLKSVLNNLKVIISENDILLIKGSNSSLTNKLAKKIAQIEDK